MSGDGGQVKLSFTLPSSWIVSTTVGYFGAGLKMTFEWVQQSWKTNSSAHSMTPFNSSSYTSARNTAIMDWAQRCSTWRLNKRKQWEPKSYTFPQPLRRIRSISTHD